MEKGNVKQMIRMLEEREASTGDSNARAPTPRGTRDMGALTGDRRVNPRYTLGENAPDGASDENNHSDSIDGTGLQCEMTTSTTGETIEETFENKCDNTVYDDSYGPAKNDYYMYNIVYISDENSVDSDKDLRRSDFVVCIHDIVYDLIAAIPYEIYDSLPAQQAEHDLENGEIPVNSESLPDGRNSEGPDLSLIHISEPTRPY